MHVIKEMHLFVERPSRFLLETKQTKVAWPLVARSVLRFFVILRVPTWGPFPYGDTDSRLHRLWRLFELNRP